MSECQHGQPRIVPWEVFDLRLNLKTSENDMGAIFAQLCIRYNFISGQTAYIIRQWGELPWGGLVRRIWNIHVCTRNKLKSCYMAYTLWSHKQN